LNLNDRPFNAIRVGRKTIEGRVADPARKENKDFYESMRKEDFIIFINILTAEKIRCKIKKVRHYNSFRKMLETEDAKKVLSSNSSIEEGIRTYESFQGYKENVKTFGVYAIEIEFLNVLE